jgi:hypothetical protein
MIGHAMAIDEQENNDSDEMTPAHVERMDQIITKNV